MTLAAFRFGIAFLLILPLAQRSRWPRGRDWLGVAALGVFGGAAAFYLWVYALERTTPTRVTNTLTVNPVAASLLAAVLVDKPLGVNLLVGVFAVGAGICITSTPGRT